MAAAEVYWRVAMWPPVHVEKPSKVPPFDYVAYKRTTMKIVAHIAKAAARSHGVKEDLPISRLNLFLVKKPDGTPARVDPTLEECFAAVKGPSVKIDDLLGVIEHREAVVPNSCHFILTISPTHDTLAQTRGSPGEDVLLEFDSRSTTCPRIVQCH